MLAAALFVTAFAPCTIQDVAGPARCGTITVSEDRSRADSRKIDLNVVVLPAKEVPERDAIFILQGGPGQAATRLAEFYAGVFADARDRRDIVLVDQRGTGKSNPLNCDLGDRIDQLFPPDRVAACRDALSAIADVKLYTTKEAIADLDEVRGVLGYDRVDLYGTSYGTRVAFEYMRRFPKRTRSVIVKGVVPPEMRYTVDPAIDTDASLQRVMQEQPEVRKDLDALLSDGGLPRSATAIAIRNLLHSMPSIRRLPALLHDREQLQQVMLDSRRAISRELSMGMHLSVTCAEDVWRVSDAEALRETGGTLLGDYWHRELRGACEEWPHAEADRSVARPLKSSIPTLLISGAYDPVTPPREAAKAARTLSNSRHIVVANGSHSFAGMSGCVDKIMSAFVIRPDPQKVDASCVFSLTGR